MILNMTEMTQLQLLSVKEPASDLIKVAKKSIRLF